MRRRSTQIVFSRGPKHQFSLPPRHSHDPNTPGIHTRYAAREGTPEVVLPTALNESPPEERTTLQDVASAASARPQCDQTPPAISSTTRLPHNALHLLRRNMPDHVPHFLEHLDTPAPHFLYRQPFPRHQRDDGSGAQHGQSQSDEHLSAGAIVSAYHGRQRYFC